MIDAESVRISAILYVACVTFFALWRFERLRRIEFMNLVRIEADRQRAALAEIGLDIEHEDSERGL